MSSAMVPMKTSHIQRSMRILIAVSFAAFGAHQLVYGQFVTRVICSVPSWIPWQPFWAYLTGILLICCAFAMGAGNRKFALSVGFACLSFAILFPLPKALADVTNTTEWIFFGKGLTLAGCAFIVAGSDGLKADFLTPKRLVFAGKCFLGAFMVLSGCLHFVYSVFVASIIPPWIPWHMFWTFSAGIALICGGVGMVIPATERPATLLSGIMILAWVPLVHIPLAMKNLANPNESVPVFEALAFGCAAILAATCKQESDQGI